MTDSIANKAIRDGKYLALSHSSAWHNVPPIKIKKEDIFSFSWCHFCARSSFYIFNGATQEVPIQNIWKKLTVKFFRIYAIELLGSLPTGEAWRHLRYITFVYGVHWSTITRVDPIVWSGTGAVCKVPVKIV